jgi:hypothetical protein
MVGSQTSKESARGKNRVFLADDPAVDGEGWTEGIPRIADLAICGAATSAAEAIGGSPRPDPTSPSPTPLRVKIIESCQARLKEKRPLKDSSQRFKNAWPGVWHR